MLQAWILIAVSILFVTIFLLLLDSVKPLEKFQNIVNSKGPDSSIVGRYVIGNLLSQGI